MELMFGGMPDAGRFIVAFVLVLGLIGAGALLWRRFGAGPLSPLGPLGPRGRQPRLAVIDAAAVDARRRLVLIKRDNVEHLLMIGGPTDIVVESNITRSGAVAVSREPRPIPESAPRHALSTDGQDWTLPLEPAARTLRASSELDASLPEPPARTAKEAMAESMQAVRSSSSARRSPTAELDISPADEIGAAAPTPPPASVEASPGASPGPEPRRTLSLLEAQRLQAAAAEPPPPYPPPLTGEGREGAATEAKRAAATAPRAAQSEENSLAEMAQRLEAALRRPTKPIESPAPSPAAARSPARTEPPPLRKPLLDAVNATKGNTRLPEQASSSPPPDLKVLSGKAKAEPPVESLEDEMAKMLGRSPAK
jgi:flagellar protein FliO/FliZ